MLTLVLNKMKRFRWWRTIGLL